MIAHLDDAIRSLAVSALPDLFGGDAPDVSLSFLSEVYTFDPTSVNGDPSQPRKDDRLDQFELDIANLPVTLQLTMPPYPGPRIVTLTAPNDRIRLQTGEVVWDEVDAQTFTVSPGESRDLTGVNGVEVLYGTTAVYAAPQASLVLKITLTAGNEADIKPAEALLIAVLELNKRAVLNAAPVTYEETPYGASVTIHRLTLVQGESPAANQRVLTYHGEFELKVSRALRDDEGRPIDRITSPGQPVDPDRPININIQVDG